MPPIVGCLGANNTPASRFKQRSLLAIENCTAWLAQLQRCRAFDADQGRLATVADREATRFISCSQVGPGAALTRMPDPAVIGSVVGDDDMLIRLQRHVGLYLSVGRVESAGVTRRREGRRGEGAGSQVRSL